MKPSLERGQAKGHRVLRGGSWNNNRNNARCAYRNRNEPDNWNNNIGFRVVVAHGLLFWPEMPHGRPRWAAEALKSGVACSRPPELRFRRANTEEPRLFR